MYLQLILALEKLLCSIFIHVEVEHPAWSGYVHGCKRTFSVDYARDPEVDKSLGVAAVQ